MRQLELQDCILDAERLCRDVVRLDDLSRPLGSTLVGLDDFDRNVARLTDRRPLPLVMIDPVLVLAELCLDLVDRQVDRGVQVAGRLMGRDVEAGGVKVDFGEVPLLLDGEDDVGADGALEILARNVRDGLDLTCKS